jgi:hypothetical protein
MKSTKRFVKEPHSNKSILFHIIFLFKKNEMFIFHNIIYNNNYSFNVNNSIPQLITTLPMSLPSITPHTSPSTITQLPMTPLITAPPITRLPRLPPPITRRRNRSRQFDVFKQLFTRNIVLNNSANIDVDCSICLVTHKKSNCVYLIKCKHMFCRRCFFRWMYTHDTCPLCRQVCTMVNCYC